MRAPLFILVLVLAALFAPGCAAPAAADRPTPPPLRGTLLAIGGGLDDDNKPVYTRFIELARAAANSSNREAPLIVVATAASGDEPANFEGKRQSIATYCPTCRVETIGRDTPRARALELIDAASAMFFTGGDQKRITTLYRPGGIDTPEAEAMRRLLARGGVIAGTSAGDAMMSDPMFFTGRSAEALGIPSTRTQTAPDDDAEAKPGALPLGPQIGGGMGFLPWAITDSHFFERHRFGRLVAALEDSGRVLGIGVGEDAAVEIDLATATLRGVSVADSLLVDARAIERSGLTRRCVLAMVIQQGTVVDLRRLLATTTNSASFASPPAKVVEVPLVEPGQNRQLASWRYFLAAQQPGAPAQRLTLDGYRQTGFPAGPAKPGWSVTTIEPTK
ncbi:MAG: cyanophycinase [Phycisphaerales bacterium]